MKSGPGVSGAALRVTIPFTRDPLINTPLISLGTGPADGLERFWVSSWNAAAGCLGLWVDEAGRNRIYRFGGRNKHNGFYSAVQQDADTLWLCGDLSRVARLKLRTGKLEVFETGAPNALVFQGMRLDHATGRLFAFAFPGISTGVVAFSFDTRSCQPVKVYQSVCPERYMRFSFPNGDGTYSFVAHVVNEGLLRWDPRKETTDYFVLSKQLDVHDHTNGTTYRLINDDLGRWYFPGRGWMRPRTHAFAVKGPRPEREMTWFARLGRRVWGVMLENGNATIGLWDMANGSVRLICKIPDCQVFNVNLTASGKIVAVNVYGVFYRYHGETGVLEISRRLATDARGAVDCLRRIDPGRLLGTPFISQRFWEVDLATGHGTDCGRAAPGCGEILLTWKLGGKIYMAAYTGGELVEYDPSSHPHFPENPRVVAAPAHGMRPVAAADDGRRLFYACNHAYGKLGSVLTRYDTRTGETLYLDDPLANQQIRSMAFSKKTGALICGTTMHADCWSCSPATDRCCFAQVDADSLKVIRTVLAPQGTQSATVVGPLGRGRWLATCSGLPGGVLWFVLDADDFVVPGPGSMKHLPGRCTHIQPAGRNGWFVLRIGQRFELWDMNRERSLRKLDAGRNVLRAIVSDGSLYLVQTAAIRILDNFLK